MLRSTLKWTINNVHQNLNNIHYNRQITMYAKTDKPDQLSKLNITKKVKVDKLQCSLIPKQCSLEVTNNDVRKERQTYNLPH